MFIKRALNNVTQPVSRGRAAVIVTLATLGLPFFGNAQAADKEMAGSVRSMEMHKSMMNGMKGMESMRPSGDADYDFAMMMKAHHQSALDMANVELQQGKDAMLRSMAKEIIKSQTKEIKGFDQWLAKHKQPMAESMNKMK